MRVEKSSNQTATVTSTNPIGSEKVPTKKKSGTGQIVIVLFVFLVFSLFLYRGAFKTDVDRQYDDLLTAIRHVAGGSLNFTSSLVAGTTQSTEVIPVSKQAELIDNVISLLHRSEKFVNYFANSKKPGDKMSPSIRWDLTSNADIHIGHKLATSLRHYLQSEAGQKKLIQIMSTGYQCSPIQAAQQELISKFISMDICSEVEWYKLVQLAMPEAQTFFDVGANKGYLGTLFLTLWGGGQLNASPAELFSITKKIGSWKGSRNPAGYCRDGLNYAIHMHCPDNINRIERNGKCDFYNPNVKVYSFDGSSYLMRTLNDIINTQFFYDAVPDSAPKRKMWKYMNYAVSDTVGVARFTKQDKEKNAGFEGGSIQAAGQGKIDKVNDAIAANTEEVPMTSIDAYVEANNITALNVLKIDTEGNDNKVLNGARKTIKDLVGMFTFEGGKGVELTKEMLMEYDQWGFNCYSTSRAGLFKWNGGCMKEKYMGSFRAKDKGNVFCVSREKATMVALAYDLLSFPAIIEDLFKDGAHNMEGGAAKRALYSVLFNQTNPIGMNADVELQQKIDASLLTALYVNIHPFCKDWPQCAKV